MTKSYMTLDEAVAMVEAAQRAEAEGLEETGPFPMRRTIQTILNARPAVTNPELMAGAEELVADCAVIIGGFRFAVKDLNAVDRARLIQALDSL